MKTRLLGALVGLAFSFALPTFAQQKETVDPKIIEQLNAIDKKWDVAANNHDAAAIAALFAEDGILWIRADCFTVRRHVGKVDPNSVRLLGPDNLTRSGEWSETGKGKNGEDVPIKGYWSGVYTREGDGWKICVLTGNLTPDSWVLLHKSFGLQ